MIQKLRTGEIWLANLNPTKGTELGKTRPVLIIQAQVLLNNDHPSTLIVPLTTRLVEEAQPLRIRVPAQGQLEKNSDLLIDQIRAIDNKRLTEGPLAKLTKKNMQKVYAAIMEVIDYSESCDSTLH